MACILGHCRDGVWHPLSNSTPEPSCHHRRSGPIQPAPQGCSACRPQRRRCKGLWHCQRGTFSNLSSEKPWCDHSAAINCVLNSKYFGLSAPQGVIDTAQTLCDVATRGHEQKGLPGAVGGVLRQIPPTVVRPLIVASEATSNLLGGMRNQIKPDARKEDFLKWRMEEGQEWWWLLCMSARVYVCKLKIWESLRLGSNVFLHVCVD